MSFSRSAVQATTTLLISLALLSFGCTTNSKSRSGGSATATTNSVATFFSGADRQYETAEQRAEIIRALQDMLSKPAQELRAQRYADYEGHKEAWTLTMLLKSYFVPTGPVSDWSEAEFYQDVSKPDVQTEIRKQLSAIEKEVPAH